MISMMISLINFRDLTQLARSLAENVLSIFTASSTPPQSRPMMMNVPTSTTTSLVRKFSGEANGKTQEINGFLTVVALHP